MIIGGREPHARAPLPPPISTSWSSARDRRAPRPRIGSRRTGIGCSSSTRSGSRARRPAATASPRGRSASSTTWAWPTRSSEFQRFDGLRSIGHGITLELAWPEHPDFPSYGYVVRRSELDDMVAQRAVKAGATLWSATEAIEPLLANRSLGPGSGRAGGRGCGRPQQGHRHDPDRAGALCDRRRRRQLPVRAGARHRPQPHVSPGDGDSRLLHEPAPRRPLDREPPRHPRPGWQPFARLRVDISGWRRHGERRASACCRRSPAGRT